MDSVPHWEAVWPSKGQSGNKMVARALKNVIHSINDLEVWAPLYHTKPEVCKGTQQSSDPSPEHYAKKDN